MNGPQIIPSCIFKDAPAWTPEEGENFKRDMDRLVLIRERIQAIDLDVYPNELKRVYPERKRANGR